MLQSHPREASDWTLLLERQTHSGTWLCVGDTQMIWDHPYNSDYKNPEISVNLKSAISLSSLKEDFAKIKACAPPFLTELAVMNCSSSFHKLSTQGNLASKRAS